MKKGIGSIAWTLVVMIVAMIILAQFRTITERAYSAANRNASIATLNGGEGEFQAQQLTKSGGEMINFLIVATMIAVALISGGRIGRTVYLMRKPSATTATATAGTTGGNVTETTGKIS